MRILETTLSYIKKNTKNTSNICISKWSPYLQQVNNMNNVLLTPTFTINTISNNTKPCKAIEVISDTKT